MVIIGNVRDEGSTKFFIISSVATLVLFVIMMRFSMLSYLVYRDVCDIVDRILGAYDVDNLHTTSQHLPGIVT